MPFSGCVFVQHLCGGVSCSDDDCASQWDDDGNGSLDFEEIKTAISETFSAEMQKMLFANGKLEQTFHDIDANGDGQLSFGEFYDQCGRDRLFYGLMQNRQMATPREKKVEQLLDLDSTLTARQRKLVGGGDAGGRASGGGRQTQNRKPPQLHCASTAVARRHTLPHLVPSDVEHPRACCCHDCSRVPPPSLVHRDRRETRFFERQKNTDRPGTERATPNGSAGLSTGRRRRRR